MSAASTICEYRGKLIDEVKKYPVLYDTRHENHRDTDVRDRCWMEISERIGADCESLKREWKILRDSLRQALKKARKGATTKSGAPCKKWRFQNRMAFLLPYMTVRRVDRPRLLGGASGVKRDTAAAEREDGWDDAPDPPPTVALEPSDSLELFFASVCQSARRLPRRLQAQLKRSVVDALARAEDEWEAGPGAPHAPDKPDALAYS